MRRVLLPALSFLLMGMSSVTAVDVVGLAKSIDQEIGRQLSDEGVAPAPLATDHSFLRRVTLDLAGRVPTTAEVHDFIESRDGDKRRRTVERLLESPDYAFHARNEIDTLLLRRLEHNDKWREYLLEATTENRAWDQLFREIMVPEDSEGEDTRPVAFLSKRLNNIDSITNDSSIAWFGVNVGCAKCHDHPLVYDWTQAHYYGMASFFKRTFRTRKGMLSERFDGQMKYTTTGGEQHDAEFMFLTGTKVDEPESAIDDAKMKELREAIQKSEKDDKAEPPPKPDFRPRTKFVEMALGDKEKRFFAKNLVNRVWARLMGRGIVHPLDQMHSENPPSHPRLLETLAEDFVAHGYDTKRLIHAIVLSDTYGRSSICEGETPNPELFAIALPRPLSPHQLSISCRIATANPKEMLGLLEEDWAKRRTELERQSEGHARKFEIPEDGFQVSVSEALWFSNNASFQNDFLKNQSQKLVGYLQGFDSDVTVALRACEATLSRPPEGDELSAMTRFIADRSDRRDEAIQQVVWALMNSPEFRFNH